MRYLFVYLLLFFTISLCAEAKTLKYIETTGSRCREIFWDIKNEKHWVTFGYKRGEESYITTNDFNLNALEWQYKNSVEKTDILAKRNKNSIQINGTFKGKPLNTKIGIDVDPWYQPMSFSLSKFIKAKKKKVVIFWTLNPLDLTPYKIKALNYGIETVKVNCKEIRAYKVKVVLAGFRSIFWHAFYWFRESDGILVLYNGVDGPPNTPMTTINLVQETL